MIDERAYELLCCQLGLANEEKAGLRKQVNELIARLKAIEESNKENSKALVDTINELSATAENYRKEMELMRRQLEAKDEMNMMLANEISNLRLQLEDSSIQHRSCGLVCFDAWYSYLQSYIFPLVTQIPCKNHLPYNKSL